jgi:transcription antitermination protein NusB
VSAGGSRREARERALELLYEGYAKGAPADDILGALVIPPEPYAEALVRGVADRGDELDELITRFAKGWTLERMPVLDRTILRIAIYELVAGDDPPVGVVISEAVELAKRYSTDDSGRFVNGVLASVASAVRSA